MSKRTTAVKTSMDTSAVKSAAESRATKTVETNMRESAIMETSAKAETKYHRWIVIIWRPTVARIIVVGIDIGRFLRNHIHRRISGSAVSLRRGRIRCRRRVIGRGRWHGLRGVFSIL